MNLGDNTVLITGGGSGIGLALARGLTRQNGNSVIVCGRNAKKLEAVRRANPSIATFPCDIASDEDQARFVAFFAERHPNLNLLINNAGI